MFKSSKIFKLYDEFNCLDVMETCLMFPIDGNLNLIAQYPLGLYHAALVEDDQDEEDDEPEKPMPSVVIENVNQNPDEPNQNQPANPEGS